MTRLTIAMPLGRGHGADGYCVGSLLQIVAALGARGIPVRFDHLSQGPIEYARAELVGRMLATPSTHLLFLDGDVCVDPSVVLDMLAVDLDSVSAVYAMRQDPRQLLVHFERDAPITTVHGHRVLEIELAGIGCTLVKRRVFERLFELHPELAYDSDTIPGRQHCSMFSFLQRVTDVPHKHPSEDHCFFRRARDAGFRLHALLDATVIHDRIRTNLGEQLRLGYGVDRPAQFRSKASATDATP